MAQENQQRNELSNVEIFQSHWFDHIDKSYGKFNLIVSNPPYIDQNDPHLQQGDVRFEPRTALIAGADGLDDLRHIISHSKSYLANNGWLLVEHGCDQGNAVRDLFVSDGYAGVATRDDLNGLQRITLGQWQQ